MEKVNSKSVWWSAEKKAVHEYFSRHVRENKLPKKGECAKFLELHNNLVKNRQWSHVKDCVRNFMVKKKGKIVEENHRDYHLIGYTR